MYAFLETLALGAAQVAGDFFKSSREKFESEHEHDLRSLSIVGGPEFLKDSEIARAFMSQKYRLTLSNAAFAQVTGHIEPNLQQGGTYLLQLINDHMEIRTIERVITSANDIEKLLERNNLDANWPAEDEGIPGHNPGQNAGTASANLTRLKLGPLPIEPDLYEDVVAELQEIDLRVPPRDGNVTLAQEFQNNIKQEETDDAPTRNDLPLPKSKVRDVTTEIFKIHQHRERFRIDAQKDKLSVCMYTFHNTQNM